MKPAQAGSRRQPDAWESKHPPRRRGWRGGAGLEEGRGGLCGRGVLLGPSLWPPGCSPLWSYLPPEPGVQMGARSSSDTRVPGSSRGWYDRSPKCPGVTPRSATHYC